MALADGRRRVQRPKGGQTQEPDRGEGQDAAYGKALLAPAVAVAEERQACRNHQQVQALGDSVAGRAPKSHRPFESMKPNACIVSSIKKPETK